MARCEICGAEMTYTLALPGYRMCADCTRIAKVTKKIVSDKFSILGILSMLIVVGLLFFILFGGGLALYHDWIPGLNTTLIVMIIFTVLFLIAGMNRNEPKPK